MCLFSPENKFSYGKSWKDMSEMQTQHEGCRNSSVPQLAVPVLVLMKPFLFNANHCHHFRALQHIFKAGKNRLHNSVHIMLRCTVL